jgi:SAM-dependent methyltransferase
MKPNKVRAEIIIQILSIGGGYSVHVIFHRWDIALVIILALECFLHLIAVMWHYGDVLDKVAEWAEAPGNPIEDIRHIRNNTIPMRHIAPPPKDWPFDQLFRDAVVEFQNKIALISQGDCTIEMEDILDVSLRVSDFVEVGAFCTALEENLDIFDTERGKNLLIRQHQAATRLARDSKRETGFTRLFIFDALESVVWSHHKLLEKNVANAIEVLVAERGAVLPVFRRFDREERMDFGLWRNDLLMEIRGPESDRKLHVTKQHEDLQKTKALINALREKSLPYKDFLKRFKSPPNIAQWSTEPQRTLNLEPPDGPHPTDCDTMFEIASAALRTGDRIAIYGLTSPLIDRAAALVKSRAGEKLSVVVVDARPFTPATPIPDVDFVRANWLDWASPAACSVVIADDVLCNLTYWQTAMFFDNLSRVLRPGGLLVMRATARFSPGLINPSWDEILSELRQFDPADDVYERGLNLDMLTHGALIEASWPTLHSAPFYNETSRGFRLGDWNERIRRESEIKVNLKNRLTFPRDIHITSMPYLQLREFWRPYFSVAQAEMPAYSLWQTHPSLADLPGAKEIARRFHEYYRIIVLQRNP